MDAATVARYLEHMRSKGTTERYAKNVGFYLAAWAEGFAGRDLDRDLDQPPMAGYRFR